ncbi:pseudaminic acid synthase [Halomonas profundus]|nr:pseudaminic acid synthase [Halomonas profundus]
MTNTKFVKTMQSNSSQSPLIIAELSGNHNQSLQHAYELIDAAARCGVDAIKLQTYTADTITLDINRDEFVVNNPESAWHGRTLHSLYEEAHTPWDWHAALIERAESHGLAWFSSPFDFTAVDFLETLGPACYKIASPELVDLPLIRKCARTGRPLIMSTGMASIEEIAEAVQTAQDAGCVAPVLLKCTTSYPSSPENSNVRTIPHLAELFDLKVGLSDHTLGIGAAIAATAMGATVIEKHLTLRRADGGPDAHFSLEPEEMEALVTECHRAWLSLGAVQYGPTSPEKSYLPGRRSLYITKDMRPGEALTESNLRSVRPGFGLKPKYYDLLLGKKVNKVVKAGTAVDWNLIMNDS